MVVEVWGEWLASRPSGQLVFRGIDSVLRLIEKSLLWSTQLQAPQLAAQPSPSSPGEDSNGTPQVLKNGNSSNGHIASDPKLVIVSRPLSWPLFLPLISFLGTVRITVYCFSRVIRKPCDTHDMILWLQNKRRQLRTIKYAGIKNMRQQAMERIDQTANGTPRTKSVPLNSSPDQERKRKYCDVEQSDWTDGSDDESVAVKLEKYVEDYDSEHDPDYAPTSEESSESEDDSATSGEEDIEEVKAEENGVESPVVPPTKTMSPNIITVESVSDDGSADIESPASTGSSVASTPLSSKSRLVKFFRRSMKTRQQL